MQTEIQLNGDPELKHILNTLRGCKIKGVDWKQPLLDGWTYAGFKDAEGGQRKKTKKAKMKRKYKKTKKVKQRKKREEKH